MVSMVFAGDHSWLVSVTLVSAYLVVRMVICDWVESKFVRLGGGRGVTYKGDSSAIPYGLSA